jgi:hypothetical protein
MFYKQHFRVQMRDNRSCMSVMPHAVLLYKLVGVKSEVRRYATVRTEVS